MLALSAGWEIAGIVAACLAAIFAAWGVWLQIDSRRAHPVGSDPARPAWALRPVRARRGHRLGRVPRGGRRTGVQRAPTRKREL